MEEKPSKGPDGAEDKEKLVDLLAGVRGRVGWRLQSLQQVAQRLDHAHLLYRSDHLEAVRTVDVQEDRNVALKQDSEVGLLRLHLTLVNPTLDITEMERGREGEREGEREGGREGGRRVVK